MREQAFAALYSKVSYADQATVNSKFANIRLPWSS